MLLSYLCYDLCIQNNSEKQYYTVSHNLYDHYNEHGHIIITGSIMSAMTIPWGALLAFKDS